MTHNNQNMDLSDFFRRNARVGIGPFSVFINDLHYDSIDPALDPAAYEIMGKEFSRDHFQSYASVGTRACKICVTRVGDKFVISHSCYYDRYTLMCHTPVTKRREIVREKRYFMSLWLKEPPYSNIGIIPPDQPCPDDLLNLWLPGMGPEMYTTHLRLQKQKGNRWTNKWTNRSWTVSASGIEIGGDLREDNFRQPDSRLI